MSCYSFRSSRTLVYHSILPGIVRRVKTELSPWRIHYLYLFGGEREILAQLRRLARFFCALLLLLWLPQAVWAHRRPLYICPEPPADLAAILDGGELSAQAPSLVTAETGLSPLAVRQLLAEGRTADILACQAAFHAPPEAECRALLPLGVTCEERTGSPAVLAPLEPGDLLITFSTHTLGWRHGHAALITDSGTVLEAAMPGTTSGTASLDSWRTYPTLLVLRVRDASPEQREAAVAAALRELQEVPYGFFSGLWGEKSPEPPLSSVQCAYLPWYAWLRQGFDLDSDGGRLVTLADLAASPLLEVVQVRGVDPALFSDRWAKE